ncbi:MAG TPA: choice-of-anchor D domain-containing protein, partial [bacterium]|nr:choice-of-anchor D domain-containing protein [bacterium]
MARLGRVAFGFAVCAVAVGVAIGCNDNNLRTAPPDIKATPNALAFTAGAFSGGATSASLTVIVSNDGGGTLNISHIGIVSSATTFTASTTGATIPSLPAGGWFAVQVTWTPTHAVADSGMLVLDSNDPDTPHLKIPITTEPVGPAIACTPNPVVFLGQPGTPVTRSVACSNPGTQPITITGMEFAPGSDPAFSGTLPAGPVTLNPGAPLPPFDVTFTASALTPYSGKILVHNDGGADYVVELDGTGSNTLPCQLTAVTAWVDFGGVNPGTTSTKTATVKNTGDVDCHVSNVSIGAITTEFHYNGQTVFVVPVGGSKSVSISYTPVDRIADIGTLKFTSDDPTQAQLDILLTGVGS